MAAELARSKSVGLLRVGHDAADVREALTQADEHCRAQSSPAEYLGQRAAAVHAEGSDVIQKTASGVYQSQWGALRTPALVAVIIVAAILQSALFRATQ